MSQISFAKSSKEKLYSDSSQPFLNGDNQAIDAVYTWVNGSDPIFLKELQKTRLEYLVKYNRKTTCDIRRLCSSREDKFMFLRTPLMIVRSDKNYSMLLKPARYESINMSSHERLAVFRNGKPS